MVLARGGRRRCIADGEADRRPMAYEALWHEYMQMPVVTRAYTTACVITTLAVVLVSRFLFFFFALSFRRGFSNLSTPDLSHSRDSRSRPSVLADPGTPSSVQNYRRFMNTFVYINNFVRIIIVFCPRYCFFMLLFLYLIVTFDNYIRINAILQLYKIFQYDKISLIKLYMFGCRLKPNPCFDCFSNWTWYHRFNCTSILFL